MRFDRSSTWSDLLVRAIVGSGWLAALAVVACLLTLVRAHPIPFDTDEADHANAALQLYQSLRYGPSAIFEAISRQAFYPPVNSFLVTATYLILGPGILESRFSSIFQFSLFLIALFILVRKGLLETKDGAPDRLLVSACACFALLAAASSPMIFLNALLIMIEPTGILLVTLLLLLLGRKKAQPIPVAVLLTLIMLTKYNFGIVVVPAVLCAIFLHPARGMAERVRRTGAIGLVFFGLMAGWILVTDRHAVWHSFFGHPSYAPLLSRENLTFDIRGWIFEYTVHPALSVLLVALSALSLRKRMKSLVPRAAFLIVVFALAILTISTTNEVRHLMVIVPSMFYLGALGLFDVLSAVQARYPRAAKTVAGMLTLTLAFGCYSLITTIEPRAVSYFEGQPEYLTLENFIVTHADASQPILISGTTDDFSLESIRYLASLNTGLRYTDVRIDSFPFRKKRNREDRLRKRDVAPPFTDGPTPIGLREALSSGYYRFAVQIENLPGDADENAPKAPILEALGSEPHEEMTLGGVQVRVYELRVQ